ncbi:hypothetical protein [Sansalvadorimonas verongulae]|uniref:hypothetical protein n=1 Tax=Sansalvadorimonas verongulae TaxID=2172824 RepID=UPI0012BD21D4|nr:hypothetical protein [Sansalvadorimonas verongulae]MTI12398.1 hypothetical protein [Sansalvadorimonas verongulae]
MARRQRMAVEVNENNVSHLRCDECGRVGFLEDRDWHFVGRPEGFVRGEGQHFCCESCLRMQYPHPLERVEPEKADA